MSLELPPFEPNLARASTLPARLYTDPAVYALERERIFCRTWQPVGRAEQVRRPGDFFTAEVAGEPLVVVRDTRGELRAFHNVCRHRAGAVADGCGNRKTLQCRYHGWTYNLDGSLLATPEFEGVEDFDRGQYGLPPVRAGVWGPFVFVNLDPQAPSLDTWLAPLAGEDATKWSDLHLCERRVYDVRCNWKVYVDNYLEGYHVPVAHPGLHRELDYDAYRVETFRFHSVQHAPLRPAQGAASRRYLPGQGMSQALYYWIFPNWMLNVYPDNLSLNLIEPAGVDRTRTVFEWYFPRPDDPRTRAEVARTVAFSDEVQQEDIGLCEAVQVRLGSRSYDRGRFSVRRENGVHHFQALVHEFLNSTGDSPCV